MKIDSYIKEQFGIKDVDIRTYSPLTLAYIGDGIFDIVIRSVVVGKGNTKASQLHKHTRDVYKRQAQGKGFYVNAQDSEMIKEQHLRKVESSLNDAIESARCV